MRAEIKRNENYFNNKNDKVVLGKVSGSLWRKEELSEGQLNHHVHVVGASGYGKTVLLSHIIEQSIQQGKGLLFIDLKGDMDTILKFSKYVAKSERIEEMQIFSLSDPKISHGYNLIGSGTPNQLRDKIMMSLVWSEEYYKNQSASYLLKLLIGLCWLRDNNNFNLHLGELYECCKNVDKLQTLAAQVPIEEETILSHFESCVDFLNSSENFKSIQGLRTQLESLIYSDFGKMITTEEVGIDLFESVNSSKITFLYLDTRRYGETAKTVGRFIIQDLKMVSAKVDAEIPKDDRKPYSVIIDEFADLAQEDFIGFLDRARSSKMSVVVAHQEICDLMRISPEFAGRLMGNTSTVYAFLQKRPESADILSGMAGTRTVWRTTKQTERLLFVNIDSGMGSKREVEEFNIHPNTIKSLRVGKCVCIKKYPKSRAYLVHIHSS